MTGLSVSVVVVSYDRPDRLHLCLLGLSQLYHQNFEIIVVCNEVSRAGIPSQLSERIKVIAFEDANISAARNRGIERSAGDIVAFIDDDAVPEPTWLDHLTSPIASTTTEAVGGYVLGRNGISFQWQGRMVFSDGFSVDVPIEGTAPKAFAGESGRAIKTEGTNMAFRRKTLIEMGGFDEAYAFYLDETDLNMRLASRGATTVIAPNAQVHHSFAPSIRRSARRVPRRLSDVGRSLAIFARKHRSDAVDGVRQSHRESQRRRLLRVMNNGDIMPGDVRRLLADFDAGWAKGMVEPTDRYASFSGDEAFLRFESDFDAEDMIILRGRFWQKNDLLKKASELIERGKRVTLLLFSASTIYHRTGFELPGVWMQCGGQWGRSVRKAAIFQGFSAKSRANHEMHRIRAVRCKNAMNTNNEGKELPN